MDVESIPVPLRARIGLDATVGLVTLLDRLKPEWTSEAMTTATLSFDKRLGEESSTLRVAVAQTEANLRVAIAEQASRTETGVRQEMNQMEKSLRADLTAIRVDLLRWSFVFWIGQVVAVVGILGMMLRLMVS